MLAKARLADEPAKIYDKTGQRSKAAFAQVRHGFVSFIESFDPAIYYKLPLFTTSYLTDVCAVINEAFASI
jgi:hypothetical protein